MKQHPSLLQINTRVVLQERAVALGRRATLDDLGEALLDEVAERGFAWIWLLGVWQTGAAGLAIVRSDPRLRAELTGVLPDVREDDIVGSPFAVVAYEAHEDFGGDAALGRLRARMATRGLRLLLDFVPNHVATDHPWVQRHPEYFVRGTEEDLSREPHNYLRVQTGRGPMILAHGRDPHFEGWSDTLQLDFSHAGLRRAQMDALDGIADRCDGVRCDMAMLIQPAVFETTWGRRAPLDGGPPAPVAPFWPEAIVATRRRHPDFLFVAEVYWDLEWELQQAGFDYTYDKRLYDRLRLQATALARDHLRGAMSFQEHSLHFLENHDEPRAAAVFDPPVHQAAAVITYFAPGLRLFHEGQREGRRIRVPMQLARRPDEPVDGAIALFYDRLLAALARPEAQRGRWRLGDARAAWPANHSHEQLVVMFWEAGGARLLAVSNYGPGQAQGYVTFDWPDLAGGGPVVLVDLLGEARFERDGAALAAAGLYLDMPPWGRHVFEVTDRGGPRTP
jgi:Alpha amylase, catalytic domain